MKISLMFYETFMFHIYSSKQVETLLSFMDKIVHSFCIENNDNDNF